MKIKSAEFVTSAARLAACPQTDQPEFAFIGRSNVGKSSLVNLLTGKRDLAKVSATPGKTLLLNFFEINRQWMLVDLPGYGYAKTAKATREGFGELVDDYIELRENLTCVFVLIDSRLPPQAIDLNFIDWLQRLSLRFALVFTKADKQTAAHTQRSVERFQAELTARRAEPWAVFVSSVKTGAGRDEILAAISRMCSEPV